MSRMLNSDRELENAFKQIITAQWNQKSDGNVEAPTGHFATIPISANEMEELLEAVFSDDRPEVTIEPGYYFAKEDSAGNMWLWNFNSAYEMNAMYERYSREYAEWSKERYFLICSGCSQSFDDIQEAYEHGASDPNTKAWCGDNGFSIASENEVL